MSTPHVLLLGGTRFIGAHLTRILQEAGYDVTVFHRGQHAWPIPSQQPPHEILGDRKELADLERAARAREWSAVVDLVAFTAADSSKAIEAFHERCEIFAHISTGSVYQVLRDYHNPYHEEDALLFADPLPLHDQDPEHPAMAYGLGKRGCEEALLQAHEETGFPVTIIRPPIVSGPLDYTLRDASYYYRLRDGGPLLVPATSGAFRHVAVQDLARLILLAIEEWDASLGEAFNAGGGSILSLSEYLQLFARVLGLPEPEILPVTFDQLDQRVGLASQPFGYPRTAIPDLTKAQLLLGWTPRRAEQYLPEVAAWLESNYQGEKPESYSAYRDRELELAQELMRQGSVVG